LATQILTFQPIKANFEYEVLRNYPKINEFCSLNQQARFKILTFVLPTEKRLEVSFLTFFQVSRQPRRIRMNRNHQKILLMQGYLSQVNLDYS